ncbi:conjugal transfer protein [Dactylosporangium sp. NPDC050688]|uniref:conjugal transfer protein n=1 Tax=Dactylosporangium sp. NPDC050688 TaxID=3157217 RepID=UPI0033E161AA
MTVREAGAKPGQTSVPARSRTARQARQARKAKRERARALSEGLRFTGSRRRWLLMTGALGVAPIVSLVSLVVALNKPGRVDIADLVRAEMLAAGSQFPKGDAVMWAGQVARVWGTWDERATTQRAVLLAPYLSQGMDSQAGWNGKGVQQVLYASVNPEPEVRDANHATIDAVYQIQDGTWRCVALPVFAYKPKDFGSGAPWAFALAGNPVPTACAPRTGAPSLPFSPAQQVDREGAEDLRTAFLPGFFAAWAASDQAALRQYTVSGLRTMGLGGAFMSSPLPTIGNVALRSASEDSDEYTATVAVTWSVSGSAATITTVYEVPLTKSGAQWFVTGEPVAPVQDPGVGGGNPGGTAVDPATSNSPGMYPNPSGSPVVPGTSFPGATVPSGTTNPSRAGG